MECVIYYGGSFSPPTLAHIAIAESIQEEIPGSKVLFAPVSDSYPKPSIANVTAEHRLKMLALCGVTVFDYEIKQDKYIPTYLALKELQRLYPGYRIQFIIGEDNLPDLPRWYKYDDLVREFMPIVVERRDDISSTKARDAIRSKDARSIERYCHPAVAEYINDNKLYQN